MRDLEAPFLIISSRRAGTAVSANFPTFSSDLAPRLSGSMICTIPAIFAVVSKITSPMQEPNPRVISFAGALATTRSAIPT